MDASKALASSGSSYTESGNLRKHSSADRPSLWPGRCLSLNILASSGFDTWSGSWGRRSSAVSPQPWPVIPSNDCRGFCSDTVLDANFGRVRQTLRTEAWTPQASYPVVCDPKIH